MTAAAILATKVCVFDAYGTLFDVAAAARRWKELLGDRSTILSELWRRKQLEYTWLRSLMGRYEDFWHITGSALDHAFGTLGIADPGLRARLMASYLELEPAVIKGAYQVLGFAGSAAAIWLGMRRFWPEVANTGMVFFVIFLYTKFFDWWWDAMPKYLFFLVVGLTAILFLVVLRRLHRSRKGGGA